MPQAPKLVPVPPTTGGEVTVDRSPFWIGSASSAALRVFLPSVAERHASIQEREDGFYLSAYPGAAPPRVNGRPISGPVRLDDAAIVELGPTAKWEFVTGAPRVQPEPEPEPEPVYGDSPAPRGWARKRRARSSRVGFPIWAVAVILLIIGAVGYGGYTLYQMFNSVQSETRGPPPLTEVEGRLYDSLMVEATKNIERGSTLLDLGLEDAALTQFTNAIALFETSILARNEWVRPSIEALVETVRRIYQTDRLKVPNALPEARGKIADLSRTLSASLSPDQFKAAVDVVQQAFDSKFGRKFVVTGADHPEHLSLYGKGGALDIRVNDLTPQEVDFLIANFKGIGIRVKDFSRDAVLQAQIQAAMARGWSDRAGTGLHLHIDRFRDRRDRWTV
jgi:FHA domain